MEFKEERNVLRRWAEKQGPDGLKEYQAKKNSQSIDGFDTLIEG
jgi:hypothetical protein